MKNTCSTCRFYDQRAEGGGLCNNPKMPAPRCYNIAFPPTFGCNNHQPKPVKFRKGFVPGSAAFSVTAMFKNNWEK